MYHKFQHKGSQLSNYLNQIRGGKVAVISVVLILCGVAIFSLAFQKSDQLADVATATITPPCGIHHENDFSGPYDSERVAIIAVNVAAPEYFVLPDHGGMSIESGWLALLGNDFGDAMDEATPLTPNLYWNMSDKSVLIRIGNIRNISLDSGGLILIYSNDNSFGDLAQYSPEGAGTVSVSCGNGYYACCTSGPPAVAVCVANSITKTCTGGGLGATGCTISQADP